MSNTSDTQASAYSPPNRPWVKALVTKYPVFDEIRMDLAVNDGLMAPGFQALAAARLASWIGGGDAPAWAKAVFRPLVNIGTFVAKSVYGIELPPTTKLGRKIRIAHQHGIVIHPASSIGDETVIRQGVSIGAGSGDPKTFMRQAPRIGKRVSLGAGCCIVGQITIGDDAVIGPNVTVMTNVPAGATMLSQPPRMIRPRNQEAPKQEVSTHQTPPNRKGTSNANGDQGSAYPPPIR